MSSDSQEKWTRRLFISDPTAAMWRLERCISAEKEGMHFTDSHSKAMWAKDTSMCGHTVGR